MIKTLFSLLMIFSFLSLSAQEIADKEAFAKCKKEFSKKICLNDEDKDSVLFYLDHCPKYFGEKDNAGCPWPDADSDGVLDKDDACPDVTGPVENKGCPWPDMDGDGVLDKDDNCPTVAGQKAYLGCNCSKFDDAKKRFERNKKLLENINFSPLYKLIVLELNKMKNQNVNIILGTSLNEFTDIYYKDCDYYYNESNDTNELFNQKFYTKEFSDKLKTSNKNIFPVYKKGIDEYSTIDKKIDIYKSYFPDDLLKIIEKLPAYKYKNKEIFYFNLNKKSIINPKNTLYIGFSQLILDNNTIIIDTGIKDIYFFFNDAEWKKISLEEYYKLLNN